MREFFLLIVIVVVVTLAAGVASFFTGLPYERLLAGMSLSVAVMAYIRATDARYQRRT